MTDYKLVPAEPTAEMMWAAQEADMDHSDHDEWLELDGDDCKRMYRAMLAAAPAVQGEPVGHLNIPVFARRMDEELEKHDISGFEPVILAVAEEVLGIEQQPAPDVAGLVEALEQVIKAAPSGGPLWHGSEQIVEARAALSAHRRGGVQQWQPIGTCPRHVDVLFYREDAGVFSGKFTDADSFMTDKERDEWVGTEEEMFDLDAWSYEPEGVYRMDGDLAPTHWMPLPAPPATQGANP